MKNSSIDNIQENIVSKMVTMRELFKDDQQYLFCNDLLLSMREENESLRTEINTRIRREKIKMILSGFSALRPIVKAEITNLRNSLQ